jgi:ABC-type transport system involved in multi-copper enzyme maturation permease subunit
VSPMEVVGWAGARRQIWAVARQELRFGLRHGWPVVGTAAVWLVAIGFGLSLALTNAQGLPRPYKPWVGEQAVSTGWQFYLPLALGVLPVVAAPAVAADRQWRVSELLRSLPLRGGAYLLGKVLGTAGVVLLSSLAMLALHLCLHLALIGMFDGSLYLHLAVVGALPLLVWATAMGVLLACMAKTRRAAVFVGGVLGLLGVFFHGLFLPPSWLVLAEHGVWVPFVPTSQDAGRSLAAMLLSPLVAGPLARLWLYWKEGF